MAITSKHTLLPRRTRVAACLRGYALAPAAAVALVFANQSDANSQASVARNTGSIHQAKRDPAQNDVPSSGAPTSNPPQALQLKEVIVTAEKRAEPLLAVPAPISAISGGRLNTLGVTSLSDLSGYMPGLTLNNYGAPGTNVLEIRGLGDGYLTDFAGPLVATYIDDEQIGSSTAAGRGNLFGVDLMPYDVERVELLKGPQGTLYGANAMGGIVRYILAKPNLSQFNARVGTDVAHVTGSGGADWEGRGMVNMPLVSRSLGLRLSGFYRNDAGWIDNLGIHKQDSNHSRESGGRAALLWHPTDRVSLQATVLAQDAHTDDVSNVTINGNTLLPLYGSQATSTHFPQLFVQKTRNYSLHLNWDLGFATLTSVAGWSKLDSHLEEDFSNFAPPVTGIANSLAVYRIYTTVNKFVEETRLVSARERPLQWLVGGYFTHEDSGEHDSWPAYTASYVPLPASDNLYISASGYSYTEGAAFGNVTYWIDEAFDIGAGARYSRYHQYGCSFAAGLLGAGVVCANTPSAGPSNVQSPATNVSNWMADARWHLNAKSMIYARVATGYRPGQPNTQPTSIAAGAPLETKPDRTMEYDLGFKGMLFANRVQIDSSLFYIDWKDLQLENSLIKNNEPIVYLDNVGSAVSSGVDLSAVYLVSRDIRLDAALAYTNAHLTANAPLSGGVVGDQLPLSARWIASLGIDYTKQVGEDASLLAGAAYRYKDRVINQFPGAGAGGNGPPADVSAPIPPWNIVDAYVGVALGSLTLRLYGKNIFDSQSYGGLQYINDSLAPRYIPIQPRTIGLSADYGF